MFNFCYKNITDDIYSDFDENEFFIPKKSTNQKLVIQLLSVSLLDRAPAGLKPYAVFWLEDAKSGIDKGVKAKWSARTDTNKPVWNKAKDLKIETAVNPSDVLHIQIRTNSTGCCFEDSKCVSDSNRSLNITSSIKIGDVPSNKPINLKLGNGPIVTFQRLDISKHSIVKRIFFIRHAESLWNSAQDRMALHEMIGFDHPLSPKGLYQCEELANCVRREVDQLKSSNKDPFLADFINAELIFSSPLARALQTALLTLEHHPRMRSDGLSLLSDAREIKNPGSFDTVATTKGNETGGRAKEFTKVMYESQKRMYSADIKINANDTEDRWWNSQYEYESKAMVRRRIEDFTEQLKYCKASRIIVVGHSLFFKAFFDFYLKKSLRKKGTVADLLTKKKIQNCGVVGFDMNFEDIPEIVRVKLLFGSIFHGKVTPSEPTRITAPLKKTN
eukprot:GHVL01043200.1.p1 GENE.GHVL01043200.1~~GHVL01043200.1.p1  ORF type:complete len:445 (-),score=86.48 GHVL01043200.1:26-1360(-)